MGHTRLCTKQMFFIASIIILAWVAPYFILGEDSHMRVHDNLDSNIAWYQVLKNSGQVFAPVDSSIPQIINGELTRNAFYSEFYAMVWLSLLFPPVIAYGLSQLITRSLAFLGMYLLLKKHIFKKEEVSFISIFVSLLFALTPYWPSGMLSILGMPLALWAFLNIRSGETSWKNYLVLTVIPFLSSFVLGFFYFLATLGIVWIIDVIRTKKGNWRFFFAVVYMGAIYLLIDYRLIASMLIPHEPTNRDVFYQSKNDLLATVKLIFKNYIIGHNQDRSIHEFIILPLALIILLVVLKKRQFKEQKLFVYLHIFMFLLSTWYAFWFFEGWQPLKEKINILTTYNFSRFHYFSPIVIYVLFALALSYIWKLGKWGKRAAVICIVAQFFVLLSYNEQIYYKKSPSYRAFYAEEQFEEIKDYINRPQEDYRVVSIGIHPAISQYNGFYTLDTYANIYPLTYKHQFRKIIENELAKNKSLAEYYDDWGGRCYIFVDELGKKYEYSKWSNKQIENLQLNTEVLLEMGAEYIFSSVPIMNAEENSLLLEKVFQHSDSHWDIYLYSVDK